MTTYELLRKEYDYRLAPIHITTRISSKTQTEKAKEEAERVTKANPLNVAAMSIR